MNRLTPFLNPPVFALFASLRLIPMLTATILGDSGLLVACGPELAEPAARLRQLARQLRHEPLAGVHDLVPATTNLLVCFDPLQTDAATLGQAIEAQANRLWSQPLDQATAPPIITIHVRYGGADGPDLAEVAHTLGLTPAAVIAIHTAAPMPVEMLGFLPGFAYIGGLPASLHLPRRPTPRVAVPSGSVALANGKTGIYPTTAPGGWHLIGRTTAVMFDPHHDPPTLLQPGDLVQFANEA